MGDFLSEKFMPDPVERLASFCNSLFYNSPITPDVREWLLKGITHYLHHGGEYPLDRFLRLSPIEAGTRSLSTKLRLLKRNLFIVEALQNIALGETVTNWEKCQRLAKEIALFDGGTWRLYRHLPEPPENWQSWRKSLFCVYKTGGIIPKSPNALYLILKQIEKVSFNAPGVKLLASLTLVQQNNEKMVLNQRAIGK